MKKTMNRVSALALALILLLALLPGSVLAAAAPGAIDVVVAAASEGQSTVAWTAAGGAAAYIIQRRVKDSDTWTTLNSNVTVCTYADATAKGGTVYQYRVRGRNGTSYGPFKASSVVRAIAPALPGAIATVTAAAAAGKTTVSWSASSGATAYIVQRRVKDSDTWKTLNSNVTLRTFVDTTGVAGTVYQYRVRGRNGASYGPFKASSVVRAQAAAATPGAIAAVTASCEGKKVTVTWSASSNAKTYTIQRRLKDADAWTTLSTGLTDRSYTDSSVVTDRVYQYRVCGVNGSVSGAYKVSSVIKVEASGPAGDIFGVKAAASKRNVTVTWGISQYATSYTLQRQRGSGDWVTISSTLRGTSYVDESLSDGTYRYRVRGVSPEGSGNYAYSPSVLVGSGSGSSSEDWDPDISFNTLDSDGQRWTDVDFKDGKLTMIYYWSYKYSRCVSELEELEDLYSYYRRKGLRIWLISERENEEGNEEAMVRKDVSFPCLRYVYAFDDYLDTGSIPTTIFVNSDGEVVGKIYRGNKDFDAWADIIDSLM